MTGEDLTTLIAAAAPGISLAAWALRQVHSLSIEVAVLKREQHHGDCTDSDLRVEMRAMELRLDKRLDGLARSQDGLAKSLRELRDRPCPLGKTSGRCPAPEGL